MKPITCILGAGMTGLAAGFSSGLPIFESSINPGGICSSYYMRPGDTCRYNNPPDDNSAYRFEIGGGHWIFGGDPMLKQFLSRFVSLKAYKRHSSVYFRNKNIFVPYPLQNNLRYLDKNIVIKAINEMSHPTGSILFMKDWLKRSFGPTLCELFFYPFHSLYTAGLYEQIAPQDAYKSPVDLPTVIQGALHNTPLVGYNSTFLYPKQGLNKLAHELARYSKIYFGKEVVRIDPELKEVKFADGDIIKYKNLISTLPLNTAIALTGLMEKEKTAPYSSLLVLNIGAHRGIKCPKEHWIYTPDSISGFHRVGFYSNVDRSFLPEAFTNNNNRISIYVERAFVGDRKPSKVAIKSFSDKVISELQEWKFINTVDIVDPTWIEVGYTWSFPDSNWINSAISKLKECGIFQVGRYGLWRFQGIADSIRDGLFFGSTMKPFVKN